MTGALQYATYSSAPLLRTLEAVLFFTVSPMKSLTIFLALLGTLACQAAWAGRVVVSNAWVRATMPGQEVAGAFMNIQSDAAAKLVAVTSPATPQVEVHEMKMDGTMMRMREVRSIDLPKNSVVSLKPGGYHIMLIKLKKPIKAGDKVPLELIVETAGKRTTISVLAIARSPMDGAGAASSQMGH